MEWHRCYDFMLQHTVRINTPTASGTGVILPNTGGIHAIATAAHVVQDENKWGQPIELYREASGSSLMLQPSDRAIIVSKKSDCACVIFRDDRFKTDSQNFILAPDKKFLKPGNQLAWVGYPSVAPSTLCFFSGHISAYHHKENNYLVDGVAIPGVSGGPAFHPHPNGRQVALVGVVSAYLKSPTTPGLMIMTNISHFHETVQAIKSIEEAQAKALEQAQDQAREKDPPPDQAPPPTPAALGP